MGIVNAYFPVERIRNFLSRNKLYGLEYVIASVFGAVTPFCSCSSVPLFIGFIETGIPVGVTFAFLITSPLVNEIVVALFLASFGWKVAALYTGSGIALGIAGGLTIQALRGEQLLSPFARSVPISPVRSITLMEITLKMLRKTTSRMMPRMKPNWASSQLTACR